MSRPITSAHESVWGSDLLKTRADFSGTDDELGGSLVGRHLLSLGHRRLGHISGEPWISTYLDRRRGFESELAGNPGISYCLADCRKGDAFAAAKGMLARSDRPTAIFAASDKMAAGVYAAAEELGLAVGSHLSVVGFADLLEFAHLRPRLRTVNQHPTTIGSNAAKLLLDRLQSPQGSSQQVELCTAPQLVIRASTAAPAQHPTNKIS